MARFKMVKNTDGNPELTSLYQKALDAGFEGAEPGIPVNFFTSLGARPDLLDAAMQLMEKVLMNGLLPPPLKEMIVTMVSIQNHCKYCTVSHSYVLKGMGVPQDVIDSLTDLNLAKVTPPQRAILEFSIKAAKTPLSINDQDFSVLRDQGLSDEEIMEITMLIGFTKFINNWSTVGGVPLDIEESDS